MKTVKDLFDSVPYEDMEPHLIRLMKGNQSSLHYFREAYDFIMAETPVKGMNDKVWIEPNEGEEVYRIGVRFLDGDWWCNALAREIVFEPGYVCDKAELAATCLWEMTYHSFSEDECTEEGDQLEIHKEVHSFLDDRLRNIFERMNRHGYRFKRRMNRSKRKRNWRQDNAADRWICLRNRHELISRMHGAFPIDDIFHLFKACYVQSTFFRSTVSVGEERVRYIGNMIGRYLREDWSHYTGALVWLVEPEHMPVDRRQWDEFKKQMALRIGVPVQFGIYTKPMTKEEIGVGITWYRE